ncbi:response regulator transcription factor [Azospirillum soli]|uniref:response regulator transcription factor n=1 Tax=Azospirillum soli TaxID=1304799 RepID=UPI001AE7D191|nr:DNA-binding CsgD family transcriptional regulator [Azospirillum soli]
MDDVYRLWDELADFDAARCDEALLHFMRSLCARIGADNAIWLGVIRADEVGPEDPTGGWRAVVVRNLESTPLLDTVVQKQKDLLDKGVADVATLKHLEGAGRFRANRLCDVVGPDWFEADYYRSYYLDAGLEDAMLSAFPVNQDTESWFGLHRRTGQRRFSEAERDDMARILRGIKWFHRQVLLSHGLLVAASPLTAAERKVLHLFLTGLPEKLIAERLGRSQHTIHDTVASIYRKFGVSSRSALMAIWLGHPG